MVVIIDYEVISPAVLEYLVNSVVDCLCDWTDLDEDSFEFRVFNCEDLSKAERVLARYV